MRKKLLLSCFVALAAFTSTTRAQLYNYSNNLAGTPASVAANASGSGLSFVNGAATTIGCSDGFNGYKFAESGTFGYNRPAMEFTISANSGFQLNVTGISANARRNNKGPVSWRFAYSTDGGTTWTNNGSNLNVSAIDCGSNTNLSWDFPDFSTYGTVIVRVYAYGSLSNINGKATVRDIVLSGSVTYADVDGDTYTSDVDCNDFNAAINPGVAEICNGIDDNCAGGIDEGVTTTYYADADGDFYGDAGTSVIACSSPSGYVTDNTDCNDADAAVNPGITEVCNTVDDDCDGTADEGLTTVYFADADGDTFGDNGASVAACSMPVGYVENNSDCNDANAAIFPGATEVCNGLDDDCNALSDEGLTFLFYYPDTDADGYGGSGGVYSCEAIAGYVTNTGDCNDADAAVNPGAVEYCNGIDDDCNGLSDDGLFFYFYYPDNDADGFGDPAGPATYSCTPVAGSVADNTDCNDADASVNPGAAEICNALDENCNGLADDGLTFLNYYADADGDTYGDAAGTPVSSCSPIGEAVTDNSDCNDSDASINPAASETCNGLDDDCSGVADNGLTFLDYYTDADADGFGDASATAVSACDAVFGSVNDNSDCNDADNAVNPSATEICNTIDDNCNGSTDEGVTTISYADNDADNFGDAAVSYEGCTIPSGYVLNSTDCNDASATVYPGAPEICANGIDEDCDGVADVVPAIVALGSTTVCQGNSVTFQATTAGTGLVYQWYKNGNAIAGATNALYSTILPGNYKCNISKPSCGGNSNVITVTVNALPTASIVTPEGLDLCGKTNVKLKANTGAGLTYQWHKDGNSIAGATLVTYYASAAGSYTVVVTNANGCSKQSAAVNVFTSCRLTEEQNAMVSIQPNPSNGNFELQLQTGNRVNTEAVISIVDLSGRNIANFTAPIANGQLNTTISIAPAAGIYLIVIESETIHYTQQIVITE